MKKYLFSLPILFFALLQGAFLPLNLIMLAVIFLTIYLPAKTSLLMAFLAGLFLDLAKGTPLGFSSFLLLITSYVLLTYSRRFNGRHPLFLFIFTLLAGGIMNYLTGKAFAWNLALILALIGLLIRMLLGLLSLESNEGIKLKIS